MESTTEPRHRRSPASTVNLIAGAALVLGSPVLTAWLLGDLSEVPAGPDADYAMRPLPLGSLEHVIGAVSAVVAVVALIQLVRATRSRSLDPLWWTVIGALVFVGMLLGLAYRIFTAAVIGANIGAGLVVIVGGPIVAASLLWAGIWTLQLLRRRRTQVSATP